MKHLTQLQQRKRSESGFTLVELAIVLVIIGLIVGGVLVGQDLIKAAEIRSTVADLERYNAAANTFRNKYNGIPGDLLSQRAGDFGLTPRDGSAGQGDGNSVVEGCAARATALGCETAVFWIDLTNAQLIGDAFTAGTGANDGVDDGNSTVDGAITSTAALDNYLPSTPLRDSSFVHIFPQGGRNYYYVGNMHTDAAGIIDTQATTVTPGLTANEAGQVDDKMDDGVPTTGIVRAIDNAVATGLTAAAGATADPGAADLGGGNGAGTGQCVIEGANAAIENDEAYNTVNDDFANELNCNLYIRSSF